MNAVPTREELFEMAARPIGSPDVQALAKAVLPGAKPPAEVVEAARRASKLWLPAGKTSANTIEAREAEAVIRARNFDLEDAVEEAGGKRGHVGQ
jgi:hypothetical protein